MLKYSIMLNFIQKYRKVIFHLLGWIVVLFINVLDIENMTVRSGVVYFQLPMWIIYILLFYFNYLVLIPKLANRSRHTLYIVVVIVSIFVSFIAIKTSHQFMRSVEIDIAIEKFEKGEELTAFEKKFLGRSPSLQNALAVKNSLFDVKQFNPLYFKNVPFLYGILLVISISIITRFSQLWKDEEQKRIEQAKEHMSSELEYLKQQINPHFLFNALNSIYSLSLIGSKNTSDSILKLSSILRYMLYSTNKEVCLEDEINVIRDYIGLQELKLTSKTLFKLKVEGDFNQYKIEPLLLIPIIENAFKYGIDSSKESFIDINIAVDTKKITLITRNSFNESLKPQKESGIGLKNVKRRLDLIYPDNYKLLILPKDGIFEVKLEINL